MRTSLRRIALLGAAVVAAACLVGPGPAVAASGTWPYTIAPGITVHQYLLKGPRRVFVLTDTLAASGKATVDPYEAGGNLTALNTTSGIATAHGALAAISGDFGAFQHFVQHAYLQDGELWGTGVLPTNAFAMTAASPYTTTTPKAYIGKANPHVTLIASSKTIAIAHLNAGQPSLGSIVGFTPRGGGKQVPAAANCSVHLTRKNPPDYSWGTGKSGVLVTYTVDKRTVCGTSVSVGSNGLVLSAVKGSTGAKTLAGLTVGTSAKLRWSYPLPGILDSLGGRPLLVQNGAPAGTGANGAFVCDLTNPDNLCKAQPRSAVAVTKPCERGILKGCQVFLIVVDGRQPGWSHGITLDDFASFLINRLHADSALNLDGGGSVTMFTQKTGAWCQSTVVGGGCLVNRPSDVSGQRSIVNALTILPGADPNDPRPR